uniref:Solute carrier family 22 member 3 n=1 Tax=Neolamprologus brichardi TaxID=32507 RepID=A0A3Q4GXL9_NEOBR
MANVDKLIMKIATLGSFSLIVFAFVLVGVVFLGHTLDHWCWSHGSEGLWEECGWSDVKVRDVTIPHSEQSGSFSRCERFAVDWSESQKKYDELDWQRISNATQTVACESRWVFDDNRSTIVLKILAQVSLACGFFIGTLVTGYPAVRFIMSTILRLSSYLSIFYTRLLAAKDQIYPLMINLAYFVTYCLLCCVRLIRFQCSAKTCYFLYVVIEFFGSNNRKFVAMTLQLAMSLLCTLIVPESPHWLFSQQRTMEAMEVAANIAKCNGKCLPHDLPEKEVHPIMSIMDLFRTPNIRKNTLILMYTWFKTLLYWLHFSDQCGSNFLLSVLISHRNLGASVCSSASGTGAIVAPFLLYRLASMWPELPLVTLLAEMSRVALPEIIELICRYVSG